MTGKTLSYSAGSTSRDPYKFRVIDETGPAEKLHHLVGTFDELQPFFAEPTRTLVVDAYPAALGGMESMTRVVTYLHAPTCSRAIELAALEGWRCMFVAQPLAGAHLLLHAVEQGIRWPQEMLWATGGYPLPASLDRFIRQTLAEQGCRLSILQAYGIAELDHTLFASMRRDDKDRPIYRLIDQELRLLSDPVQSGTEPETRSGTATHPIESLRYRRQRVPNHDRIEAIDSTYRIGGDATRYADKFIVWLEAWRSMDWDHFTGYFAIDDGELILQRRHQPSIAGRIGPVTSILSGGATRRTPQARPIRDMKHFAFVEHYGMSWLEKPRWCDPSIKRPSTASERVARTQAA